LIDLLQVVRVIDSMPGYPPVSYIWNNAILFHCWLSDLYDEHYIEE